MRKYKQIFAGLITAFITFFVIDRWIFESVWVSSHSMEKVLLQGDHVFIQRVLLPNIIPRFSIVVFRKNLGDESRSIKRVIALPGECVEIKDGRTPYINRAQLFEVIPLNLEKSDRYFFETKFGNFGNPLCLKDNEYYVLGDHRLESLDSRVFGVVHRHEIEGIAKIISYSYHSKNQQYRFERFFKKLF